MSEISKYDQLLNDLTVIHSEISVLNEKLNDITARNAELERQVLHLKDEKTQLVGKIQMLEESLKEAEAEKDNTLFSSLSSTEKEALKNRIREILSRIENYTSS